MKLQFTREIAAPANLVWSYLCEPDRMNTWSTATVKVISPGEGGHPGGPGTHRRVFIRAGGRNVVLDEVIRDAAPGSLLVYQVVDNTMLRSHLGTIRLSENDGLTRLVWDVQFSCLAPGMASLFARVLRKELGHSLDGLKQQLEAEPNEDAKVPTWADVPDPSHELWRRGEDVLAELRDLGSRLDGEGDPKRIFPHIYAFVCEGILDSCRSGGFVYPAWALHMMPVFYEYYLRNYRRWIGAEEGQVESHWSRAFRILDGHSNKHTTESSKLLGGLVLSVHAHVESDLPRTFAEVYVDNYADVCDYNRFRGDYYCMGQIFIDSFKRVQGLIPTSYLPSWAKVARRVLPEDLMQQVAYNRAYDLPKRRRAAFRRGAELAEMLLVRERRRTGGQSVPH